LLLVAFLLVNAANCDLSLVLAPIVQGDAVNCNICPQSSIILLSSMVLVLKLFHITFSLILSSNNIARFTPNTLNDAHLFEIRNNKFLQFRIICKNYICCN